jgi:hypothetical protein
MNQLIKSKEMGFQYSSFLSSHVTLLRLSSGIRYSLTAHYDFYFDIIFGNVTRSFQIPGERFLPAPIFGATTNKDVLFNP